MIDAPVPLSIKFFRRMPFCFGLTFLELLSFEIMTPKVIGTRSV